MNTQAPARAELEQVKAHLDGGGVVAAPTDTIYGLLANACDAEAVARVFALKGRDFSQPLPLVVRDRAQAAEVARELPPVFAQLADRFWPGPLTLVVPAGGTLAAAVTAGTGTVGMRQPNLPLLQALLELTGYPLTATSANRSGGAECRTAAAVAAQLGEAEGLMIVDGGESPRAQASTILDLARLSPEGRPRLLRAGAIAAEELAEFL